MSMDRLPPIVPMFRHLEYGLPRSLILFLQSAPPATVLSAFQADCEARDTTWLSSEAQACAVEWFVVHSIVKKYPPRRRMVRALLKAYITAVEEQQYVSKDAVSSTSSEDPVRIDLMEEFIRLSVSGEANEQALCFKTFYNPYVGAAEAASTAGTAFALPAPPSGPPMSLHTEATFTPQPPTFARLTTSHSSPTQLQPAASQTATAAGAPSSRLPVFSAEMLGASAPHSLRSHSEPARPVSPHGVGLGANRNTSTAPLPRIAAPDTTEDLAPMAAVHSSPSTPPKRLSPGLHAQHPPTRHSFSGTSSPVAGAASLDEFSAIRVSTEQFTNVGLSLWPAAFVLVQLLAQELKGQTRLLADVLGLPRAAANTLLGPSPVPLLTSAHGLHSHPASSSTTSSIVPSPRPKHGCSSTAGGGSSNTTTGATSAKPYSSQLRILELGAGAGLTPVFLHRMEEYKQHVASFLTTDYQEAIVENIRFNMAENGIQPVADLLAAKRGLEGDCGPPYHRAALLDWLSHDENEGLFMENEVDVVLAADCIYDADVIPALVDTIHLALTARGTESYMAGALRPTFAKGEDPSAAGGQGGAAKQRCCIVVQTHRQNSTMQRFFSAVRVFGQVRSYTLVRQPAGTLRLSQDHSGIDGGCVPIGAWDRQTALLNPERVVCALIPDVVLEDGSMRHANAAARRGTNPNTNATAIGSDRSASLSPAVTPRRASHGPGASSSAAGGKDYLIPILSSRSLNSVDSHGSFSRSGSSGTAAAASLEATEALLADEMIGPFYTSMVGLIGVHVITLKPTRKLTR